MMELPIPFACTISSALLVLMTLTMIGSSFGFLPPKVGSRLPPQPLFSPPASSCGSMALHDRSSTTWFNVGDCVIVDENVFLKNGENLRGKRGTVIETWEKCEVDPTCCCAEQVDVDMAVRVRFEPENGAPADDRTSKDKETPPAMDFTYYFAEGELNKI